MGLEVRKIFSIVLFVLLLPVMVLADMQIYTGGVKGGATAFDVSPRVLTTDGGVSVWTVFSDKNLVYAMIPRTMYESGADDVNRNMGSAAFSGVTGWYRDPATSKLTHYAADAIPFEEHAGIYTIPLVSATTNYITYSELFSNAAWGKANSSVTAGETDPMGTSKAFRLGENQDLNTHFTTEIIDNAILEDNKLITVSVFAKEGTRNWMSLQMRTKDGDYLDTYFDLATGLKGTGTGVSSAQISEKTYNGFYRISITAMTESGASDPEFRIKSADSDGGQSYQGDGSSYIIIFGVMISETPSAHPYLPTEGSIYVWAGNQQALTYSLDTMETALDGTTNALSGTSLWGEQLGAEENGIVDFDTQSDELIIVFGTPTTSGNTTAQFVSGTSSWVIVGDSSNDGVINDTFTSVAGKLYKMTANIYPDDSTTVRFRVKAGDGADNIISALSLTGLTQDSWNSVSVYWEATTGGSSGWTAFFTSSAGKIFIDDWSVKPVLNAWDSGDGDGLEPPHFTLIQAVRHTYNRAEVPADATNHGYVTTRNDSTGTLIYRYQNGISLVSFDGTTAAQAAIDIVAHSWSWLVLEVGKLNSNVSQFRLCEISGGLSCGAWADYDGDYSVAGSNLHYFFSGFGYIHFGPLLIYRSHLDSTFFDQLGNGG